MEINKTTNNNVYSNLVQKTKEQPEVKEELIKNKKVKEVNRTDNLEVKTTGNNIDIKV